MEIRDLRKVVLCYYRDEKIMKEPIGFIAKRNLSQKTIDFLHDFVVFVLNSNFINAEAKVYLLNKNFSYYDVVNDSRFLKIKDSTIRYHISNSIDKINRTFSNKMLVNLIDYREDAERYIRTLEDLKEKYSAQTFFKNKYIINFPDTGAVSYEDVDMNRVSNFLNDISCYKKEVIKNLNIDKAALAYVYRLLDNAGLSEKEAKDRIELKKIVKYGM